MRKTNHRLKSNILYRIRREETKRILESGSSIPSKPSLFNSSSKDSDKGRKP